jgi:hypothetical protein
VTKRALSAVGLAITLALLTGMPATAAPNSRGATDQTGPDPAVPVAVEPSEPVEPVEPAQPGEPAEPSPIEAQSMRPVGPTRLLDTRLPGQGPAFRQGEVRDLQVGGVAGVPATATGVALNVTVTGPTTSGFLSLFPAGSAWPGSSNLNYVAGQSVANMVIVGLGEGDRVAILNSAGLAHVVVDVTGWFTGGFRPITPLRLLDTRSPQHGPALVAGETRTVAIAGRGGIPFGIDAVAVNITVVAPATSGFVSAFPAGQAWPGTSSVNHQAGHIVANMALSGVGSGGRLALYSSSGPVHVIIDVTGWFRDGFTPLTPARVADTRQGACGVRLGQGDRRSIAILGQGGVPAGGVAGVALNLTATNPTASSFLTVYPKGAPLPTASNLNVTRGRTVANLVTTGLGPDGAITVFNALGTVDIVIDLTGWFEGSSAARPLLDCQVLGPAPPWAPPGATIPPGTFAVGTHIAPGRYGAPGGSACSWQRSGPGRSGAGSGDGGPGRVLVDLLAGDTFASAGCGVWTAYVAPAGPSPLVGDGDWVVSEDMAPGVYRSTAAVPCRWEHRMGFGGTDGEVIDDGMSFGTAFVEIAPFEVGFRSRGCGSWGWVGPPVP